MSPDSYHSRSGPSPWVLGFHGRSIPAPVAAAIQERRVGGLCLFRDNFGDSVEECLALREEILSLVPSGTPFLLMADEEGGLIHPTAGMTSALGDRWPALPSPRALGRLGKTADARWVGQLIGERLRQLGVHVDLAPCLDLDTELSNPIIASRSFGSEPQRAADLSWAFTKGLQSTKTVGCLKHYPGHGGTKTDSHKVLPKTDPASRRMHEDAFLHCLGSVTSEWPWIMTAHIDWGDEMPASLSRAVIGRLTRRFPDPLVITDSLDMAAVSLEDGAAQEALLAHNDVLLVARDWNAGLRSMHLLEEKIESVPSVLAALVRSRSRIRETWESLARRRRGMGANPATASEGDKATPEVIAERNERLAALHRRAVLLKGDPAQLPRGKYVWVLPRGLEPYFDLSGWTPPSTRSRSCEEVAWLPEKPADWAAFAEEWAKDPRPKLLGTALRGPTDTATSRALKKVVGTLEPAVLAHLLDEGWSPASGGVTEALLSGPSTEGLTGLAEALGGAKDSWNERNGSYFPVDS